MLKHRHTALVAALVLPLFLMGCVTHLTTSKATLPFTAPAFSAPYWLPQSSYDVSVEWKAVECVAGHVKLTVKPTVKEKVVKGDMYLIDMQKVQGWARNGNIEIAYDDDGFLKSINGSSEDVTADIATSVIGSLAKIATITTTRAGGNAQGDCSAVADRLNQAKGHVALLQADQKRLDAARADMELNVTTVTSAGQPTNQQLQNLAIAIQKVQILDATVALDQKAVEDDNDFLTYTDKFSWVPTNDLDAHKKLGISPEKAAAWNLASSELQAQDMSVGIAHPQGAAIGGANLYKDPIPGIPYLVPGQVSFKFCSYFYVPDDCSTTDYVTVRENDPNNPANLVEVKKNVVRDRVDNVNSFQFGQPFVLPVDYMTFTSRTFSMEFNKHILTKVSLGQTKSFGQGAAGVFGSAAGAYSDVSKAQADAKGNDTKAATAALNIQKDYMTAQLAVADLQQKLAKPQPDSTTRDQLQAQLDDETLKANLAKAQLDRMNAEAALAKAMQTQAENGG